MHKVQAEKCPAVEDVIKIAAIASRTIVILIHCLGVILLAIK